MSFAGKRVLALESRRAHETAELIRRNGGEPFVAPSMREVPIEANSEAFRFAERLFAGEFDMIVFLTGVGTRYLTKVLATKYPADAFAEALRKVTVVARGPKPVAALREMDVPVAIAAPEPNTWREVLAATEGRPERRIAVQLYGKPNEELVQALERRGAEVTSVPVYQWALPEDTALLLQGAEQLAAGLFDVSLWTTSQQVVHLVQVAPAPAVLDGVRRTVVASIGPTTSETLREHGIETDLEASHPKLGFLVKEAAEKSDGILRRRKESHAAE